jgi:hypothetical protein
LDGRKGDGERFRFNVSEGEARNPGSEVDVQLVNIDSLRGSSGIKGRANIVTLSSLKTASGGAEGSERTGVIGISLGVTVK